MATKILGQAWRSLRSIYRFEGERIAPRLVEPSFPVSFVHDLSREAELTSAQRVRTGAPIVVPGASTTVFAEVTALGLFNLLDQTELGTDWTPADVDIWLERVSATSDVGANTSTVLWGINTPVTDVRLGLFLGPGAPLVAAGRDCLLSSEPAHGVDMPQFLPQTGSVRVVATTNAGGAATPVLQIECIIVPRGVGAPKAR